MINEKIIDEQQVEETSYYDTGDSSDEKKELPFIYCDSLVKIYKTKDLEVMALQGLDLSINQGEIMCVIGKSGSGKSTLMNIIGGLEKPSAGKILVDGVNISEMSNKQMTIYRKNTVGFVWQKSERNLYPYLTSIENVEASLAFSGLKTKEKRRRALELLDLVGMTHKKDSYPTKMSGGEQQRIAIAVAIANNPKILLADEPTGAVDTATSNQIQDLFRKLNKELGITVIIVTHDMKLANKVDRVVMISDGKISTEKIMKEKYRDSIKSVSEMDFDENLHEEYSVMDKAHRIQLNEDMLAAAGIDTNKVRVTLEDGKLVIVGESSDKN